MKTAALLKITIKPSRRLLFIEWVAHFSASGAVLAAGLPTWTVVLLMMVIGTSLGYVHRRWRMQHGVLVLHGDGRLEKVGAGDTADELIVHPHTTVLPFLIVLLYRYNGRTGSLVVLGDSLAREDFRQLRLWLRWRAAKVFAKESSSATDAAPSPMRGARSPDNPG
jgi:toxin CptA